METPRREEHREENRGSSGGTKRGIEPPRASRGVLKKQTYTHPIIHIYTYTYEYTHIHTEKRRGLSL